MTCSARGCRNNVDKKAPDIADVMYDKDALWQADTNKVVEQHQVVQHTATVNTMKSIVLVGIVLSLAVLIIWPFFETDDRFLQLGISDVEVVEQDAPPELVRPRLYGIDANGQPYTITANTAEQKQGGEVLLKAVDADITLDSGAWMSVTAKLGTYWQKKREMDLEGDVVLVLDNGYEFETDTAFMDLKMREARGDDDIDGQGPLGTLRSNSFFVENGGELFVFTGDVHVVSYP